jgi:hypothetical protein
MIEGFTLVKSNVVVICVTASRDLVESYASEECTAIILKIIGLDFVNVKLSLLVHIPCIPILNTEWNRPF